MTLVAALLGAALLHAPVAAAPPLSPCAGDTPAPACAAIRGDRAEGWAAQSRSEVIGQHGMVATSQPLAAQAGLDVLRRGGNAVDAAVATAGVLSVVEPMMVGPAGDLFAIVYDAKTGRLYALDASGLAPSGATPDAFAALGYRADPANWGPGSGMPPGGVLAVTVPGSVWGWDALLKRFGTMTLADALAPAQAYAEQGFPLSERIAADWRLPPALPTVGCCKDLDPDSVAAWYVGGRPPAAGEVFRNQGLARTLRLIRERGADAFYKGEIAAAIVAKSRALGGTMTREDLAAYRGRWVEPVRTTYKGHEIYELPPPSQSWAALEMLNILEACVPVWAPGRTLADIGPRDPLYWHLLVEAKKLAYADLIAFNADPTKAKVPVERLIGKAHARSLCGKARAQHAAATGPRGEGRDAGDTVVLTTADAQGNMVAVVNSNFSAFGSGLTVPGYGLVLHNRGALFSLDLGSPNVIAPHKRPYNTLAAGFVMKDGAPVMTLLLMGGDMQAQGHAQVLVNLFDLGANLQMATDMARFRHTQVRNRLVLEPSLAAAVGDGLKALGHDLGPPTSEPMGGLQSIAVQPGGGSAAARVYRGASDHRKDA